MPTEFSATLGDSNPYSLNAMGTIYRTPLLVTRKAPFVEWLRSLEKPVVIDDDESARLTSAADVYLLHVPGAARRAVRVSDAPGPLSVTPEAEGAGRRTKGIRSPRLARNTNDSDRRCYDTLSPASVIQR